jgi:hypothetical protein
MKTGLVMLVDDHTRLGSVLVGMTWKTRVAANTPKPTTATAAAEPSMVRPFQCIWTNLLYRKYRPF